MRRSHRRKSWIVLSIAAVLLTGAAIISGVHLFTLAKSFDSRTEKIDEVFPAETTRPEKKTPSNGRAPMNFLMMGTDSRSGSGINAVTGAATDQRADTIMLVRVPADRSNIYMVSIMRDLWVDVPGHGQAKINAALAYGGVPLMVQTVESLLGQRIDHVAAVNFEGFKDLTDALGGVQVDVPLAVTTPGHTFTAGPNDMNGEEALAFVRERYSLAQGDYQRVRNQQSFLKGVLVKMLTPETFANPATAINMVNAVSPYISVDKALDSASIAALAFELRDIRPNKVAMLTLPTAGIGTSADGQSIILPHDEAMGLLKTALTEDNVGAYVATNTSQNVH